MKENKFSYSRFIDDLFSNIDNIDSMINSFVYLPDKSHFYLEYSRAKLLKFGGMPIGIKDIVDVKGMPTSFGSNVLGSLRASHDARIVSKLKKMGFIIQGKTQTHEFATGIITPQVNNPWDLQRIAGGSSGGSAAAVSSGISFLSLGTDTAGSIRIPASFTGVVGYKTSQNTNNLNGIFPESYTLDSIGYFSKSVTDLLQGLPGINMLKRLDIKAPISVALPKYFFENADKNIQKVCTGIIDKLSSRMNLNIDILDLNVMESMGWAGNIIDNSENLYIHRGMIDLYGGKYNMDTILQFKETAKITLEQYILALRYMKTLKKKFNNLSKKYDIFIAPTTPFIAPKKYDKILHDPKFLSKVTSYTIPYNMLNYPAINVPCGFSNGMPVGIQISGRQKNLWKIFDIAKEIENIASISQNYPGRFSHILRYPSLS